MTSFHLTFDVDWAPDWSVREVLEMLAQYGASATFFITHDSPTIREIADAGHSVGIHPNFATNSSQGASPTDVVGNLLGLWPDARAMRTHGLQQSSLLLRDVATAFPELEYDLSILTYGFPHSGWFDWRLQGSRMRRLNYTWEDDFAFDDPHHDWRTFTPAGELSVLDFHPIHVSLNSSGPGAYEEVKAGLKGNPLWSANRSVVDDTPAKAGTRDYLRAVLESGFRQLSFEELLCVSD